MSLHTVNIDDQFELLSLVPRDLSGLRPVSYLLTWADPIVNYISRFGSESNTRDKDLFYPIVFYSKPSLLTSV
jgi:hypothetical protein